MRINQPVTQKENRYPEHYNLLSTTDTKGFIKYASSEFCEVAGFTLGELEGQPHNLVRHPDMPPAAFKDMWEHLKKGKSWMGMVKNRCKNGDHYWVDAFATPIMHDGKAYEYQSVRSCPDRELVDRAEKLYPTLKEGKLPWQLKLPRTRLWQRCGIAFILASVVSFVLGMFAGLPAALALQLFSSIAIVFMATRKLENLTAQARNCFDNPLMELVYTGSVGDISEIELALRMRGAELNAVVGRIMDSSEQVLGAASRANENGRETASNIEAQNAETDQMAAAINQMSATSNDMANNTQSASDAATQAQEASQDGMDTVSQTVDAINQLASQLNNASKVIADLEEHGKRIGAVSDVISGIAEQTNLLALNAAIEAARAGEQGRGFAVVADEVRALAQRTQESTSEIQTVISEIQNGTSQAVDAMAKGTELSSGCVDTANLAGEAIQRAQSLVNDISDRNHQIATAVEEQAAVAQEMNSNVQSISEVSQANVALAGESVTETSRLVDLLDEQRQLVIQFRKK
ncbi:methyl-accepting chemotaxis protein [Parasalinivibrio latis]|uniref:methyl-accepting chemotaxis protein n=1 Tax=Parasalinivibrio latis TaxID=2952610 RepID=UPI0030E134E3